MARAPGVAGGLRLAEDMVGPQVISRIMQSPDFEAFGSTRPRGQNDASARWQRSLGSKTELEFNPHDGVHQSIGGNMSQVSLSARDPIFYLHHANIDRLWTDWNRRGNANSAEAMWRNFSFNGNFINGNGSRWDVGVGDLLAPPALGYRYDDDSGPFAADLVRPTGDLLTEKLNDYRRLDPRALASAGPGLQRIDLRDGRTLLVAAAENEQIAARDRPIAISVPLGRPLGEIVGEQAFAFRPDKPDYKKYRRYVWAVLRDIEAPIDPSTRVRVFTNCHALSPSTPLYNPSYTTSLSFFGGAHAHGGERESGAFSVCVDLTPALARMDHLQSMRADRLNVQLLPHCSSQESRVSSVRPRRVEVVIL